MSSFHTLSRRVDAVQHKAEPVLLQSENSEVLALITASLCNSIAAFEAGSLLPVEDYTPEQQAAIDRFSRRYNCDSAKDELLRKLEHEIASEEASA